MNLFMSYDNAGFAIALQDGTDESFNESHSVKEQLRQMVDHAEHDLALGLCASYEIYAECGELILSKEKSRIQ